MYSALLFRDNRLTNAAGWGIIKMIRRRIPVQTSIAQTLSRRGCLVCKRQGFFSAAKQADVYETHAETQERGDGMAKKTEANPADHEGRQTVRLVVAAGTLSVICIFIGFSALLEYPLCLLLWLTLMLDSAAAGGLAAYVIRSCTERYSRAGIIAAVTAFAALAAAGIGVKLYFFGKGRDDPAGAVVLFFFALPLVLTALICLIVWLIERAKSRGAS